MFFFIACAECGKCASVYYMVLARAMGLQFVSIGGLFFNVVVLFYCFFQ